MRRPSKKAQNNPNRSATFIVTREVKEIKTGRRALEDDLNETMDNSCASDRVGGCGGHVPWYFRKI